MIYESLIAVVESHLENLTKTWTQEVRRSEYLETYKKLSDSELESRGNLLFSNLLDWLMKGASNDDAAEYFRKVGSSRISEGFPLTEIYYALHLEKKVLWSFVAWKDEVTGILKAGDALEFMTVINNYFDLGDFYIIKGYQRELYKYLFDSKKFSDQELKLIFANGGLYQESKKEVKEKMYSEGLSIGVIR